MILLAEITARSVKPSVYYKCGLFLQGKLNAFGQKHVLNLAMNVTIVPNSNYNCEQLCVGQMSRSGTCLTAYTALLNLQFYHYNNVTTMAPNTTAWHYHVFLIVFG